MEKKHHHAGHRARLRQRYKTSPESITDHELLELLLFYAIPQKDTNELAHRLLERCGSLTELLFSPVERIRTVEGMGEISATIFPLMQEFFRRHMRESIERIPQIPHGCYDAEIVVHRYLPYFEGLHVEKVLAIGLDQSFRVIGDAVVSSGNRDSAAVEIPLLGQFLLRYKPNYVVFAHNHPSGISLPSDADFASTEELRKFLDLWGVCMVDNLIFDGQGDCVSFQQSGDVQEKKPHYDVRFLGVGKSLSATEETLPLGPAPTLSMDGIEVVNNLQNNKSNT